MRDWNRQYTSNIEALGVAYNRRTVITARQGYQYRLKIARPSVPNIGKKLITEATTSILWAKTMFIARRWL